MVSQNTNLPFNDFIYQKIDRQFHYGNPHFHTAIKPYKTGDLIRLEKGLEDLMPYVGTDTSISRIEITTPFNISNGIYFGEESNYIADLRAGLSVTAIHNHNLAANFTGYYGTLNPQGWDELLIDSLNVIPGWNISESGALDRQFLNFDGYLSYKLDSIFTFEIGKGKHFFGNGINSLFYSTNAPSYPYFKINTKVWHIQYVNLFSWMRDIRFNPFDRDVWLNKFTSSHYLSWNISKYVNVSLFETIIWQGEDSLSNRGFDLHYLNPVIFLRPIEFYVGSADNAIIGANANFILSDDVSVYGQFIIDEFLLQRFRDADGWWGNKFGFQLGTKYFDAFGIKDYSFQAELNLVRPFTYTHGSVTQNFGHFNQPLAHTIGSNFYNIDVRNQYETNRWLFNLDVSFNHYGRDPDSLNLGGDIYRSYVDPAMINGNEISQGISHYLWDNEISASYFIEKRNDFRLFASLRHVHFRIEENSQDHFYLKFGARYLWPNF